jgi:hypothetical protein
MFYYITKTKYGYEKFKEKFKETYGKDPNRKERKI